MEEIIKRLMENHLYEMSTVGRFTVKKGNKPKGGELKVMTTSDSSLPQVHVHVKEMSGEFRHSCVKLDKPEYFLGHGTAKDKLDNDQIDSFIEFMKSPSKQKVFTVGDIEYKIRSNWDYTIATWNEENPSQFINVSMDNDGYIIVPEMPDYNKLKEVH